MLTILITDHGIWDVANFNARYYGEAKS